MKDVNFRVCPSWGQMQLYDADRLFSCHTWRAVQIFHMFCVCLDVSAQTERSTKAVSENWNILESLRSRSVMIAGLTSVSQIKVRLFVTKMQNVCCHCFFFMCIYAERLRPFTYLFTDLIKVRNTSSVSVLLLREEKGWSLWFNFENWTDAKYTKNGG